MLDNGLIFSFIAAITVVIAVLVLMRGKRTTDVVGERVRELSGSEKTLDEFGETEEERSSLSYTLEGILSKFKINYQDYMDELRLKFDQAGLHSPNAPIYYVFFKKLGLPVGIILGLILITGNETGTMKLVVIAIAALIVYLGFAGADMFVRNRKEKRQYVLQRSFPDALDLILVCVEAGLALDAALSRVCRELESAHPEITYELNKTRMELTLLSDRAKALHNLSARTDMVAFRALVGALLQSEKFGTSLTETLRVLAEDYRTTRMLVAENKANRLPALMTIPLMLLMMPAFIMIIMAPAILMLVESWGPGLN